MQVRPPLRSLQRGLPRFLATTVAAEPRLKGPPFARYFWYTTGIMLGLPGVIGGVFVYNLHTDDEFYGHFSDRYPDLIDAIDAYVPLNKSLVELAKRADIGPVGSTQDLIKETVQVVATLRSGHMVHLKVPGSTSEAEIEALAIRQSSELTDRVDSIVFVEEGEDKEPTTVARATRGAWPPVPRVMWGGLQPTKKPVDAVAELRGQIEEINTQQAALEESKYAGRDIDEADEEIAALEQRKIVLKEQLPRKRSWWIF